MQRTNSKIKVLVTGGAGYIGSHTVCALISNGFDPIILDNLSNSSKDVISRIQDVAAISPKLFTADYADQHLVRQIITDEGVQAVVHFAASKYVGESVEHPLMYYKNNVSGFVNLLEVLQELNIPVIFSSSAACYGSPSIDKVTEDMRSYPESPYGWSKLMDEVILRSVCLSPSPIKGIGLRYFNVIGAHPSANNGEMPSKFSQNIWPFMVAAAKDKQELTVYGNDYPTPDGTCLRDYVHVVDLAYAHVVALLHLLDQRPGYFEIFNVGTGKPTSILELIKAFEQVNNLTVPYKIGPRRPGDPAAYYAVVDKINSKLGWKAQKTLSDALADGWRWQQKL